jgi:hypothetical protein
MRSTPDDRTNHNTRRMHCSYLIRTSCEYCSAMAAPMPDDAPVISTRLPKRKEESEAALLFCVCIHCQIHQQQTYFNTLPHTHTHAHTHASTRVHTQHSSIYVPLKCFLDAFFRNSGMTITFRNRNATRTITHTGTSTTPNTSILSQR